MLFGAWETDSLREELWALEEAEKAERHRRPVIRFRRLWEMRDEMRRYSEEIARRTS